MVLTTNTFIILILKTVSMACFGGVYKRAVNRVNMSAYRNGTWKQTELNSY